MAPTGLELVVNGADERVPARTAATISSPMPVRRIASVTLAALAVVLELAVLAALVIDLQLAAATFGVLVLALLGVRVLRPADRPASAPV